MIALDLCEANEWTEYYLAATPEVATRLRVAVDQIDGATATCLANIDILAFNRVIGLGLEASATESTIDRIMEFYAAHRPPRVFVQLHPNAVPANISGWLEARGFRHHNNWVKLHRGAEDAPEPSTDLRIEEVGPDRAELYGSVLIQAFDMPKEMEPLLAGVVGRPGWRTYLAFDGDAPVATASLFVHGKIGELAFAGTLPQARGRGAQQALIARRLSDARKMGCTQTTVATAQELPDKPVGSFRNVRRAGFEVAYVRPNWIYDAGWNV